MSSFDWTRTFLTSGAVGGIAGGLTYVGLGSNTVTTQYGFQTSLPMYIGAATAISEIASLYLMKTIFPSYSGLESILMAALNVGSVYAGLLGSTYAVVGSNAFNQLPKGTSLGIAIASVVGAEYLYTHFLANWFGGGGSSGVWY